MESLIMLGGVLLGTAMLAFAYGPQWRREYRAWQAWRPLYLDGMLPSTPPASSLRPPEPTPLSDAILPGAAYALAKPPHSLQAALDWLRRPDKDRPFAFPLGWVQGATGGVALNSAGFVGDVNHILITGQSDVGKDNLALNILLTLCLRHTPQELQIAIIDGKGLDFAGFQRKAHTWGLALEPTQIAPMMQRLSAERERRRGILAAAGVSKWDSYQGDDLPLLVVYVSELSLLEDATSAKELAQWLNSELAAGRAFGLRDIIATQSAANFPTRWRSQIGLFLAGFQPSPHQDQPNTGLTTNELATVSSVPPSKLPAPPRGAGVFTAVQGAECETVRCTYLSDDARKAWLSRLPDTPQPRKVVNLFADERHGDVLPVPSVPTAPQNAVLGHPEALERMILGVPSEQEQERPIELVAASTSVNDERNEHREQLTLSAAQPVAPIATGVFVPEDERTRILALAATGMPRREIVKAVYGGNGKYDRVRAVLNEHDLVEHSSSVSNSTTRHTAPTN